MRYNSIYLDGAANTPMDKKVFRAMKPYLRSSYVGNSFAIHEHGVKAMTAVEDARASILNNMFKDPNDLTQPGLDLIFTSGATEANNMVVQGLCLHELTQTDHEPKKRIVVSAIEHSSILKICPMLEKLGFEVVYVKPNKYGQILSYNVNKAIIRDKTLLVCVMSVNNETGVGNMVNKMAKIAHARGALFLSDMTQFMSLGGKYVNLGSLFPDVDYFTFSAHKLYGPTGVGALVYHSSAPVYPLLYGGDQESGLRPGTSNVAAIVGFAKAVDLMAQTPLYRHYNELYVYLLELINKYFNTSNTGHEVKLNVEPTHENIISLNLGGIFGEGQLAASSLSVLGISCSAGSACDSSTGEENVPSHVLKAQGMKDQDILTSVRISFTKYTTKRDIKIFVSKLFLLSHF